MSNILKWIAVAVVLLFSSTALCGNPDWPEPPSENVSSEPAKSVVDNKDRDLQHTKLQG